jgi:hypothetical protein
MDTTTVSSFFDELEKIAEDPDEHRVTKERFKRFLRYGAYGAAGTGLGYGLGHLAGRPIERKLLEWGVRQGPARAMRYLLPTAAGLGAGLSLARGNLGEQLISKVKGGKEQRHSRSG